MKKLLLVLLVVTLASFLFVGCVPTVVDDGDDVVDGDVATEVVVAIADSIVLDGKTYVSGGAHDITVTFPAPVTGNVTGNVTGCTGDYSKSTLFPAPDSAVVLFPNPDKTVWDGSATFYSSESGCCASYVEINSGECSDLVCIVFPVIVDDCAPYAEIELTLEEDYCVCGGCAVTFSSITTEEVCEADVECCGDDCSGLASWSITLYDGEPFDVCCDPSVCEEPIGSDSGVCPVDFTTVCLTANTTNPYYYAVIELVDNVGLETTYYVRFTLAGGASSDADCVLEVFEGFEGTVDCVDWNDVSADIVGSCVAECLYSMPLLD